MKNKIFLTGSEGFLGSHLLELLVKKNYNVKALVQYNSFNNLGWLSSINPKILKEVEIIFGDVRDKEFIENSIKNCSKIIHLAALIGIPYSYNAARSYVDTNINGTLNLLEATKKRGIEKFIHTSTSEVYGSAKFVPMTEDHPINPQSPYAATKSAADKIAMSYFYSFNIPITILRPFNIFGPRQSSRAVIPTIINQVKYSNSKILLGSKLVTRDFTFVSDTALAFEKALNAKKINGELINIGSNFEVSIEEIVRIVNKFFDKDLKINLDPKRLRPKKSEVTRLFSSNLKAKKLLLWKPQYTKKEGFKKALIITCKWFVDNIFKENYKKYIL
jgi:dTDP-glucose 4,6-dehydratase